AATGLAGPARRSPEAAVALAEVPLAAGDAEHALARARRLAAGKLPPALAARVHLAAARAALAAGEVETAVQEAEAVDDAEVRVQVADAVLALPGGPARATATLAPLLATSEPPVRALPP